MQFHECSKWRQIIHPSVFSKTEVLDSWREKKWLQAIITSAEKNHHKMISVFFMAFSSPVDFYHNPLDYLWCVISKSLNMCSCAFQKWYFTQRFPSTIHLSASGNGSTIISLKYCVHVNESVIINHNKHNKQYFIPLCTMSTFVKVRWPNPRLRRSGFHFIGLHGKLAGLYRISCTHLKLCFWLCVLAPCSLGFTTILDDAGASSTSRGNEYQRSLLDLFYHDPYFCLCFILYMKQYA